MAALWSVLQTLMIMLGLLFSIISLATESWSAVSFEVTNPDSSCPKGGLCFILPLSVPQNETDSPALHQAVQIGVYNATNVALDLYSFGVEQNDVAGYGTVQVVVLFPSPQTDAQTLSMWQHISNKVYLGKLTVTFKGKVYTAAPLPPTPPLQISIDFGLVKECFQYDFPLPEFSTPLTTRVCFSKTDICAMVDSMEMSSLTAQMDAKDVQGDISSICKKMTATVALCAFVIVSITLVALVVIFPTVRRFSCHLATPPLQAGLLAVAYVMSMCAVVVWGTVVYDAKSMEQHFQDQLQKTEIGAVMAEEMPRNFSSKLSYSFYLQLCTMFFTIAALALTYVGGIRKTECLMRPFPRRSAQAKLHALQTGDEDDDDADDDQLINNL